MINTVPGQVGSTLFSLLSQSSPLTTAQVTSLKAEITTDPSQRGYTGMTGLQKFNALNTPYSAANTAAQSHIPVTAMPREAFLHVIADLLFAVSALPDSNAYKAAILTAWSGYAPIATAVISVDFSGVAVTGIMGLVVASGVATQQQIDAFAKMPDPQWQSSLPQPSRASVVLGNGTQLIEVSDIAAASV